MDPSLPLHSPERAKLVDPRRVTIPAAARAATLWAGEIKKGATAVYELSDAGRVRLLRPNAMRAAMKAAQEAGDDKAAAVGTLALLEAAWETDTRLTLPDQVTDRLFGVGVVGEDLMVWGRPGAIELMTNDYWLSAVGPAVSALSQYIPG